jgi:23S rRNA (cytidine1920-2'-O)/16S rRNA (cytidine1409-2'-O)-methyltransferase
VKNPETHRRVLEKVSHLCSALGFDEIGVTPSPILGGEGNREFLICGRLRERAVNGKRDGG